MKRFLGLGAVLIAAASHAQNPDTLIKADLRFTYSSRNDQKSIARWVDPFGNYSKISLELMTEPGFKVFVSERLQKIDGNADSDQLDEYFVEDQGSWRVGKQYLGFGRRNLVKESVMAASAESNLILGGLRVSGAVFDGGAGRARGGLLRIGGRVGISGMAGEFLGAQSTTLALVRPLEAGPGKARGYRLMVGIDAARRSGKWTIQGEAVAFRRGHDRNRDKDLEVSDFLVRYDWTRAAQLQVGWSRNWRSKENFLRASASVPIIRNAWIEPFVRTRGNEFWDGGVIMRVRF